MTTTAITIAADAMTDVAITVGAAIGIVAIMDAATVTMTALVAIATGPGNGPKIQAEHGPPFRKDGGLFRQLKRAANQGRMRFSASSINGVDTAKLKRMNR